MHKIKDERYICKIEWASHSLSLAVKLLRFSKLRLSLFEKLEIKLQPKEWVHQEDALE